MQSMNGTGNAKADRHLHKEKTLNLIKGDIGVWKMDFSTWKGNDLLSAKT